MPPENNNSKLNTVLLFVLIILVAFCAWMLLSKEKESEIKIPITEVNDNQNNGEETEESSNTMWVKSSRFGILYPSSFDVYEGVYLNPTQQSQGALESEGLPEARFSKDRIVISWGGAQSSCIDSEFGVFEYGISQVACVKSMRAQIGVANVRDSAITKEEVKLFGDFVLKNK